MGCADHLRRLLAPLGVYDLGAASVSGAMADALGDALDEVRQIVSDGLRDAFPQTAAALAPLELALPPHGAGTAEQRRAAIVHLLGQGDVCCSADQLEAALAACGTPARLTLSGDTVSVHTALPETAARAALVRAMLPAHLDMDWVQE